MKIEIDHDACIGCGMCKYIDDKTFDYDEQSLIIATTNKVTDLTKEAAENCPVGAINITELNEK